MNVFNRGFTDYLLGEKRTRRPVLEVVCPLGRGFRAELVDFCDALGIEEVFMVMVSIVEVGQYEIPVSAEGGTAISEEAAAIKECDLLVLDDVTGASEAQKVYLGEFIAKHRPDKAVLIRWHGE